MSMLEDINKKIEDKRNKRASALLKLHIFVEARRFIKRKFSNKEINQKQFGLTMRDLERLCVYENNTLQQCNATIRELNRAKKKYVTDVEHNSDSKNTTTSKDKIDNILEQLTSEEKDELLSRIVSKV